MFITILGFSIPVYGLCIALGGCAAAGTGVYLIKRNHLSTDNFILLGAYAIICAYMGAKFLYLWVSRSYIQWDRFFELDYFRMLMAGGYVFYGGLAGGLAGLWLAGKIHRIRIKDYLCACIPILPLAHGFGRVGCGLAGCCYGIPYKGPLAVCYGEAAGAPLNISLFPVQYLEAGINFILAFILFMLVKTSGIKVKNVFVYLILYSSLRFILEFFRYDSAERGVWLGISTSQWISVCLFFTAVILWIAEKISVKKEGKENVGS